MFKRDSFVILATGTRVSNQLGAPSIDDVRFSLGKICRYGGNSRCFWPVLLHVFVVADLLPIDLKVYGLLHDSIESVTSDLPSPFKTSRFEAMEMRIFKRFLTSLGLPMPTVEEWSKIKAADKSALQGEVWTVGSIGLQSHYTDRDEKAEEIVQKYLSLYPVMECVSRSGAAVEEFQRRYLQYANDFFRSRKAMAGDLGI